MGKYKRYEKYKDSGVEWIGQVPEDWEVNKLKNLCSIGTGDKDTIDKEDNGLYPFFVRSPIVEKISTYSYDGEAVLTAGDGVGVGKVFHYINGKFDYHQRVYKMSGFKKISAKYFFYYIKENFIRETEVNNAKSTVDSIRLPMIKQFPVCIPSIYEQTQIANFLDQKTSEIDALIADKEKLIKLLEEKRQAVITEAVTKGLNPNVKMKDSGVEWIGEVPQQWEVKKLKYIGEAIIGLTYSPNDITDETGTLVLRSSNVQNNQIVFNDNVHVNVEIREKLRTKEGDIIICSRNGSRELIGKNAYIGKENEGITFGAFMTVFRSKYNKYIKYVFNSTLFKNQSGSFLTSTVNQLTINNLYSFLIPMPPIEEQALISDFLEQETSEVDGLVIDIKSQVQKLKQYLQSLISEAVTGKIDVRDYFKEA